MDADYRLFREIVAAGSLAAAGRSMRLSPAMVSKRLARLETRLGTQLIQRTTRRLTLTARGARFHQDVLAILGAVEAAEDRVSGRGERPSGPLGITAPTSFGRLHVAPLVGPFLAAYPDIDLRLDLDDDLVDLAASGIDLAIRITAEVPRALVAEQLATSPRILCAAPAYLAAYGAPATVDALARHRVLATTGQLPWRLARRSRAFHFDGTSHVRTNSSEVVRELALAGVGIALRSLWDVDRDLAAGRLVRVLPEVTGSAQVGIFAVHPRSTLTPAGVHAFIAALRAFFGPVPPWERDGSGEGRNGGIHLPASIR